MKKYILSFVCELEGFKTSIKSLHWDANSLSQHQLCDDIASLIADYQDKVAEVEQSNSGRLPLNNLKGTPYKVSSLKKFVEDVISSTKSFYSKLKKEGDDYIGMRSDTEAFLSDIQRQLYLVDFTIKESLKERLRNKINENRVTISNGREKYSLTENELREYVSKAIHNLKETTSKGKTMNNKLIKLTESDLHKIIKESVQRILREDDFGSFDYSVDMEYQRKEAENDSSVYYLYYVDSNQFIPFKLGDKTLNDNYFGIRIKPVFGYEDEDGFEMENVDYEIEETPEGWDKEQVKQAEPMIDKIIYANYDSIHDHIKKNAPYHIY